MCGSKMCELRRTFIFSGKCHDIQVMFQPKIKINKSLNRQDCRVWHLIYTSKFTNINIQKKKFHVHIVLLNLNVYVKKYFYFSIVFFFHFIFTIYIHIYIFFKCLSTGFVSIFLLFKKAFVSFTCTQLGFGCAPFHFIFCQKTAQTTFISFCSFYFHIL